MTTSCNKATPADLELHLHCNYTIRYRSLVGTIILFSFHCIVSISISGYRVIRSYRDGSITHLILYPVALRKIIRQSISFQPPAPTPLAALPSNYSIAILTIWYSLYLCPLFCLVDVICSNDVASSYWWSDEDTFHFEDSNSAAGKYHLQALWWSSPSPRKAPSHYLSQWWLYELV